MQEKLPDWAGNKWWWCGVELLNVGVGVGVGEEIRSQSQASGRLVGPSSLGAFQGELRWGTELSAEMQEHELVPGIPSVCRPQGMLPHRLLVEGCNGLL